MKALAGFKAIFKGNRSGREKFVIINAENLKEAKKLLKTIKSDNFTFDRFEMIVGCVFAKKAYIEG